MSGTTRTSIDVGCYAPVEISYKGFKFLITMKPSDSNLAEYISELKKHKVTALYGLGGHVGNNLLAAHSPHFQVKLCAEGYDMKKISDAGIIVLDLSFEDGKSPPNEIIDEWFRVLKNQFEGNQDACIAVHCVSGLGRAPVMVALALIELGMKYEEAVEFIRKNRRGAINAKQLSFLEKYKRRHKLENHNRKACVIQ